MRRRSWSVAGSVLLVALIAGLSCHGGGRRRTFCGSHADTVETCCPEQDYDRLRVLCQQDVDGAAAIGAACAQSVRDYYECAEQAACMDACGGGPDPCVAYVQTMIGACNDSPPPPPDP